jgi:hypothetical protein
MDQSAQARAVAEVRKEVMKNVADLETIERKLRDMAGTAPTLRLEPLVKRIEAAGKDAAEIKAMFGPLDPDVVPLKLFQRGR